MAVARLQAGETIIEHNDNTPTNYEPAFRKEWETVGESEWISEGRNNDGIWKKQGVRNKNRMKMNYSATSLPFSNNVGVQNIGQVTLRRRIQLYSSAEERIGRCKNSRDGRRHRAASASSGAGQAAVQRDGWWGRRKRGASNSRFFSWGCVWWKGGRWLVDPCQSIPCICRFCQCTRP